MMMLPSHVPISLLTVPFSGSVLGWLFDEPTLAALVAYEYGYARRAGYALGPHGEWISEFSRWTNGATGGFSQDASFSLNSRGRVDTG
jgi:hypothetical protein